MQRECFRCALCEGRPSRRREPQKHFPPACAEDGDGLSQDSGS